MNYLYNRNNNLVVDYNVYQGVSHPSDLSSQIIRYIDVRYISIENSSPYNTVAIAITNSPRMVNIPPINFYLKPGEIRHIGINTFGSPMQYIHILNLHKQYIADPYPFRTDGNQFVLREGINKWFVHTFHTPSFRAA